MNTSNTNVTIEAIAAAAAARVALCDQYLDRRNPTLRSHQWVVVSSLCNGRGAYSATVDGQQRDAVGMFPRQMPTLLRKDCAEHVAEQFNALFAAEGNTERMRVVHDRDWWTTERAEAQSVVDTCASLPA